MVSEGEVEQFGDKGIVKKRELVIKRLWVGVEEVVAKIEGERTKG